MDAIEGLKSARKAVEKAAREGDIWQRKKRKVWWDIDQMMVRNYDCRHVLSRGADCEGVESARKSRKTWEKVRAECQRFEAPQVPQSRVIRASNGLHSRGE